MNYSQTPPLPIEFRFAVACCRAVFDDGAADEVRALATGVDWDRFVAVAERHRIEGLVWDSLGRLGIATPPEIARRLSASSRSIADHNLRAAAESARLAEAFRQAGIDLLFFKGLTVARLAYGNPFLKMSADVDVLAPLGRLTDAATLLGTLGYRPIIPATGDAAELSAWHRRRKESVWVNSSQALQLELHGRLTENPRLMPRVGLGSPREQVEVARAIVLPTLARDPLFAYLCVHGTSSGWHRLKWLADLAGLLHGLDAREFGRLHSASQRLGAGKAAGQALLLAQAFFGTPLGTDLEVRLRRDRATRWMVRKAIAHMADSREPTEIRFGTLPIHLSQLLLAGGWTSTLKEAWRRSREALRNRTSGTERSN